MVLLRRRLADTSGDRSLSPLPRDRSVSPPTQRRRSRSPEDYHDRDVPARSPGAPITQAPTAPAINLPRVVDIDPFRRRERERQLAERLLEEQANEGSTNAVAKKSEFDPAAEFAKLVSTRSGGAYIPPSRLRAMQKDAEKDKSSVEWQRMTWDALRKSINGLINKVRLAIEWLSTRITDISSHTVPGIIGQRGQYQIRRPRDVQREPHPRSRTLCSSDHEGPGLVPAFYARLFRTHRHHQYQAAHGRGTGHRQADQSVQEGVQA